MYMLVTIVKRKYSEVRTMKKIESRVPIALAIVLLMMAATVLLPLPLNAQSFYGSIVGT